MFSYDTKMNLIPALESMGIKDAFDPGLAQFDSIVADPAEGLYVGQVEHRITSYNVCYTKLLRGCCNEE